jgi:hypothetical protein
VSTEVIPGADEATRSAFSCSTHDRAITTTWSPRSFTEICSAERDLVGLTASITSLGGTPPHRPDATPS